MPKDEKKIVTFKELCELLSISRNTLYKEISEGLPHFKIGNSYRFDYNGVIAYYQGKGEQKNV